MKFLKDFIKRIICIFLGKDYFVKWHQKRNSALLKENGVEALDAYTKTGKVIGANFIPLFGTLLGAYREHDFIPFDDDIDMGLDIKYLSNDLIKVLKNSGFDLEHIYISNIRYGVQLPMKYKGLTCDIYFLYKEGEEYHTYIPMPLDGHDWLYSCKNNIFRVKDFVLPFISTVQPMKFRDRSLNIPSNVRDILSKLYGKDFMTPKENAHSNPPAKSISIKEKFFNSYPIDLCIEFGILNGLNEK